MVAKVVYRSLYKLPDEQNVFHCFIISFSILIKHRLIKLICIMSGIRSVLASTLFYTMCSRVVVLKRTVQEKLNDLVCIISKLCCSLRLNNMFKEP